MKDKASADTQRTEAVNCMVEITDAERREREEESEWGREKGLGCGIRLEQTETISRKQKC